MRQRVFVLVDCVSFYPSCEQVFQAALHNRPTVVLSNNDGCIVALDPLAKQLGLKRGQPYFQAQRLTRRHGVQVFSSNYSLYQDMSARVMRCLAEVSPHLEEYSIDEAWLEVSGLAFDDLTEFGHSLKARVYQHTGLPVRVAIASTKCLAKIAAELVKADARYGDVLDLTSFTREQQDEALAQVAIENVWGIGPKYARFLRNYGILTARDLRDADARWLRKHLTVVGARIQMELQGVSCIPLEVTRKPKQQIVCAKSFGRAISTREELEEAVCTYTARVAEKLREQDSLCGRISVFVRTNPFDQEGEHYANEFAIDLPHPTAFTPDLLKQARRALSAIYRDGYRYQKAGVTLGHITPLPGVQPDLFGEVTIPEHERQARLMAIVDALNQVFGHGTLVFAAQGLTYAWRMRQDWRSPRFTTRWDELLTI